MNKEKCEKWLEYLRDVSFGSEPDPLSNAWITGFVAGLGMAGELTLKEENYILREIRRRSN